MTASGIRAGEPTLTRQDNWGGGVQTFKDFARYQMENPDKYPWLTWSDRLSIRVQTLAVKHLFSAVLIIITALLVGLVFGYAYLARIHLSLDSAFSDPNGETV